MKKLDVCPDRETSQARVFFITEITYVLLFIYLVKMDIKIWPGNVHGGERFETRFHP